jgi:hypothetical protein
MAIVVGVLVIAYAALVVVVIARQSPGSHDAGRHNEARTTQVVDSLVFSPSGPMQHPSIVEGARGDELASPPEVTEDTGHGWVASKPGPHEAGQYEGARSPESNKAVDADRAIALYVQGRSIAEVAALLGCGRKAVARVLREAGVVRDQRGGKRLDAEEIRRRYEAGASIGGIARALGASHGGVADALDRAGIPRRPRDPRPLQPGT